MKSLVYIFSLFLCTGLFAQQKPNVLIIGDIVSQEPARAASTVLKDRVNVVFGKNGIWDSSTALANFEKLLDDKKWDLIYFNFGLNEIMHKDPATKGIRAMHKDVGGVRVSTPEQYEKNLKELLKRFKARGSKVIWGSTTPVTSSDGILFAGDEIEYNKIAARVMNSSSVPIVDMHARGIASHKSIPRNHGKTYSYKNGLPLHPPIVAVIMKELKLARPVKGPVKVFIMAGDSNVTGQGMIFDTIKPRAGRPGTLDELVLKSKDKYKHLLNGKNWAKRNDVWVKWQNKISGALSIGFGERGNMIGPELGFGHVIGNKSNQQVLIYKPYLNRPSLGSFFTKNGLYKSMMDQMKKSLKGMNADFPDYTSKTGFEIGGVVLSFGRNEKDAKSYAANLSRVITEMRKDLKNAHLPIVIMGTFSEGSKYAEIIKAQQAVAKKLPKVSFLDTRKFRADKTKSPDKSPERLYGNAESFYKIGEALGQEMLKLK